MSLEETKQERLELTLRALHKIFSDIATFGVIGLPFFLLSWAWTQDLPLAVIVLGGPRSGRRGCHFAVRVGADGPSLPILAALESPAS